MGWFNLSTKKRPAAQGFKPAKARRYAGKAIRLEEMNTPSVLLPVPDSETVEEPGIDVNEDLLAYLPTYNEIAGEDASVDELADIQDSDEIKVQMDADDVENSDIDINNLGLSKGFDDTYIPDEDLEEIPFIHFSDEMSDSAGDETNLSALAETNFDIQKDIADEEVEEIPLATLANEISDDSEGDADRVAIAQTSDSSSDELNTGEIDETANDEADTPIKISDSNIENANPDEVTGEAGEIASVEIDAIAIDETEDTTSEDGDLTSKTDDIASADTDTPVTSKTDDIASADTDTPVTSETDDIASADTDTPVTGEIDDAASVIVVDNIANPQLRFDSGVFTVGETGKVEIDFLFDGGGYKGEVAIISLEGLEKYEPGSEEFIKEAAFRANSHSELGYIAISDREEGARFTAELGEINQNEGAYLGVKTFIMRSGDQFGIMLVPNGTIQQVFDNPAIGGALRPLFSMATANPLDNYQVGQLADVTGDGSAFAIEDMRVDGWTDKDYNDIVFQVRGATGKAALMDDVVNPVKDWRGTDMGVALIEYVKAYVTPEEPADDLEGAIAELLDDLEDFTDDLDAIAPTRISLDLDEVSVDADAPNANIPEHFKSFDEKSAFTPEEIIADADNVTTDITEIVETSDKVTDPLPEEILGDDTETSTGASAEVGEESIVNADNSTTDILKVVEISSEVTEPVIEVSPAEVVAENPPADIPELVETFSDATEPEEVLVNTTETPAVELSETGEESIVSIDNTATDISKVVETSSEATEAVLEVSPAEVVAENQPTDISKVVETSSEATEPVIEVSPAEVVAENPPADLSKVVETSSDATEPALKVSLAVEEVVAQNLPADLSKVVETSGEVTKTAIERVIDDTPVDATDPVPGKVIDEVIKNPDLDRLKIVETSAEETSYLSEASPVVEDKIVHATEKSTIQILETVETSDETDNATEAIVKANKIVIDADKNSSDELTESFDPESEESEIDRNFDFLPHNPPNVKAQLISRLESLTESLKQQETSASGGASVSVALLEKLETLTESLKNQSREMAVSEKTTALIERLEDMVVKVAPKPVQPVQSVQFEFVKASQPLVGVISETGFSANHPELDYSRITLGLDRVKGDANPLVSASESNEPVNPTLEIIGATQNNSTGINGINDDAPLFAARASGSSEQLAQSLIEFVDAAKADSQPNAIVNLSLNLTEVKEDGTIVRRELTPAERAAIAYAQKHNVLVVVTAGDKPGEMSALGQLSKEFDNVITVGAAERVNDAVALSKAYAAADYSGSGDALDILADGTSGNTSGTSVAAAKVAGAASQVWAANPQLNYTQVIDILKRTATDLGQANWDVETGAGLLNIAAAVSLAKATEPEVYTVKPGQRTITDNFILQPNADKTLPGAPTQTAVALPGIPQTSADRGANDLSGTRIRISATHDVIDQVSNIDPTDVYRVTARELAGAEFQLLAGQATVSILTPSGQVLSQQVLSHGIHALQVPAGAPGEVLLKIDSTGTDTTYVLSGFESEANEPFNIDLEFEGGLTASQQAVMQAAAKSVASLIAKGLPSAIVDGKIIDDINIKISTANVDGAGGTQARTKIDFMRYGTLLPAQSLVQLDAADIAELERSGQLFSVAQHEFLHALGFGNLWEAKGLVDYAGTPLAQYNGKNAVEEFQKLGGLTEFVSLETEGDGSAGLHWNEALFQDEVMTYDLGFKTETDGQVFSPISTVTIASLADLGYEVNLDGAAADFGLFGGEGFNPDNLTPEQIEAFRKLAEDSVANQSENSIPAIMPEVDPAKVAPEIWAHAERFWKNNEYYDWVSYRIPSGDNLSSIALRTLGNSGYDYYMWIANHNGIPDPDYIVAGDTIEIPQWHPNYEWEQEQERLRREAELRRQQEEEERRRREEEERIRNDQAEQERLRQEEEARRREAEAHQRELEEQERRLREEQERRRQQEEWEREQARLAELARQAEIARQQGKGGLDWYLAKPLSFGDADPFEINLGDVVGNLVPDDYYRFTLSRGGRLTAELKKLLADADLVLYDARNRPIGYSMREGITDEQIITDLIPGTYMLRVNSPKGVTTDYDLIVKFQHKLSMTQQGPPPGWQVGKPSSGGSGVGGATGSLFGDPRIQRIYDTALANFAGPARAKANAEIAKLESEKRSYEQEMQALLDQMNAEQRAKVHQALDDARHNANVWVDNIANPIKNTVDNLANGIIDKANWLANSLDEAANWLPSWPWDAKGEAKKKIRQGRDAVTSAVNSARSWLKGKLTEIQDGVKSAIWHFFETIKNAYRTGAEINQIVANAAQTFRNAVDRAVQGANNLIGQFKGQVLSAAKWTENLGFGNINLYNNLVKPAVDAVADGFQSTISGIGNGLKGIVDWIEPRTQKAVADIVNALLGDKTGHLWNKIHGVDAKIAATRTDVEKAISATGQYILGVARQIEAFLTDPEERKRVLDALWQRGFKTVDEAYNFIIKKRDEVRKEIETEKEARRKAEEEARRKAEEEARRKAEEEVRSELEQQGHPLPDSITPVTLAIWFAQWNLLPPGTYPELGVHNHLKRHYFENLELQPKSGGTNSYILGKPATQSQNWGIYQEAVWKAYKEDPIGFLQKVATKSRGVIPVNLSNGQVWGVNPADGTLIPKKGPNILDLSTKEARYLDDIIQGLNQGQPSKNVLNAVNAKRLADGTTTISPKMETALKELQRLKGIPDSHIAATFGNLTKVDKLGLADDSAKALDDAAKFKAAGRTYKFVKWGGRTLLVIGLAVDGYEIYVAENKEEKVAEKVGAWAGSAIGAYAAGQTAAYVLAPVNAVPGWGQFAYGVGVAGASIAGGIGGYMAGEEGGKIVYKWFFEKVD